MLRILPLLNFSTSNTSVLLRLTSTLNLLFSTSSSLRFLRPFSSTSLKMSTSRSLPSTIIFDLDDCLWSPEMYTLNSKPTKPITGELGTKGSGVIGVSNGSDTVKLFPSALKVCQRIAEGEFPNVTFGLASSSEEPTYSKSCLSGLDILPGLKMNELFPIQAIGRTRGLTSRKTTHFASLKKQHPEMVFSDTLFFDDCNWGDHVGDLNTSLGVKGIRTPNGLTEEEFEMGLDLFK